MEKSAVCSVVLVLGLLALLIDAKPAKKACYPDNCKACADFRTCEECKDGYRLRFTPYGRITLCVKSCGFTLEEYRNSKGNLACRKRTDTEGCATDWCTRCLEGYVRVQKQPMKFVCEKSCPPDTTLVYSPYAKANVCMKSPENDDGDSPADDEDDD